VATQNIGLVGTLTTSYNDPFSIARRLASLDLISKGRAGWNVVTSGDAGTAGNFSLPDHFDYDTRYRRAAEFLDVTRGLWASFEDGALVRDRTTGQFLDADRLRVLDHRGEFFSVVGPLNIQRSPQGEPVIFQAGDSNQGRNLGASVADAIFTHCATIEQGQAFYADLKGRATHLCRDPNQIVILPGFSVYVGDSDTDAREIERHYRHLDQSFEQALAEFGRPFGWHAPGVQPSVNDAMVSWVDIAPTILDYACVPLPALPMSGKTLLSLLGRESGEGRDTVFASHDFHEINQYYPMRAVRNRTHSYILNIASPLDYPIAGDVASSPSWLAIAQNPSVRVRQRTQSAYRNRPAEEIYDLREDSAEVSNIADEPRAAELLAEMRNALLMMRTATHDPWLAGQTDPYFHLKPGK
jgi:alkanesulfonate monooxygenase SsuD/methylene tetrahydromethanopterin reductase-like flavin-dependent oxidoreductase (luciferase family)